MVYNSADSQLASRVCRHGVTHIKRGITAIMFYLERERGPYVMDGGRLRSTRADLAKIKAVPKVKPNGFAPTGEFIR